MLAIQVQKMHKDNETQGALWKVLLCKGQLGMLVIVYDSEVTVYDNYFVRMGVLLT